MTLFDDVIIENEKVTGMVVNWTPVDGLPRQISALDSVSLASEVI